MESGDQLRGRHVQTRRGLTLAIAPASENLELFQMNKEDIEDLSLPDPSTGGDAPR
jgi:hypothetical protein